MTEAATIIDAPQAATPVAERLATDLPEGSSLLQAGDAPRPERNWRDFFIEVLRCMQATKQYAWDGKNELDPGNTCKLIATHQWQEVRRVAFGLMQDRPKVRALGWPVPIAQPETGLAGLHWEHGQEQWFTVHFGVMSSARALYCTWERRCHGGTLSGRSRDMRDLAQAIESTFRS